MRCHDDMSSILRVRQVLGQLMRDIPADSVTVEHLDRGRAGQTPEFLHPRFLDEQLCRLNKEDIVAILDQLMRTLDELERLSGSTRS
jgi:hypothetical protein